MLPVNPSPSWGRAAPGQGWSEAAAAPSLGEQAMDVICNLDGFHRGVTAGDHWGYT